MNRTSIILLSLFVVFSGICYAVAVQATAGGTDSYPVAEAQLEYSCGTLFCDCAGMADCFNMYNDDKCTVVGYCNSGKPDGSCYCLKKGFNPFDS